jgi:cell division protein FtsB
VVNGLLVLLLVSAAVFGDGGVVRHERLAEELQRLHTLNDELSEDNLRLKNQVEALRHDDGYVASVIRDELGWVRADELVLILPPVLTR